jgi:hypothetical protein
LRGAPNVEIRIKAIASFTTDQAVHAATAGAEATEHRAEAAGQ